MSGRPKKQLHLAHITNNDGSYLYAARFASGVVKIGSTCQPYARAVQLQRERGERVDEFEIQRLELPSRSHRRYIAENVALQRAWALCAPEEGRREYFSGLAFKDAVLAIRLLAPQKRREAI